MAFASCLLALPLETSKHPISSIFTSSSSTDCSFTVAFNSASRRRGGFKLPISTLCCKMGHRVPVKAKSQDSEATLVVSSVTEFKHLLLPITDRNPYLSEGTRQVTVLLSRQILLFDKRFDLDKSGISCSQPGCEVLGTLGSVVLNSPSRCLDTYPRFSSTKFKLALDPYFEQAIATTAALAKNNGADITVVLIDEKQKESFPEHENQLSSIRWHLSEGGFQEFKLLERLGEGSKPTAIIGEVADDLNLDLVVLSMEAIHSKHVDANLLAEFIPCPVMLLPL